MAMYMSSQMLCNVINIESATLQSAHIKVEWL